MGQAQDFWDEFRRLSQRVRLESDQSATILGEMFLAAVAGEAFVPQIWTYESSWGSLVTRIDLSSRERRADEAFDPQYRPIRRPPLTPIQLLAYSILRDGEEPATVAALLDEAMAIYAQADEPVTEQWLKDNGWPMYTGGTNPVFVSPNGAGNIWVWFNTGTGECGIGTIREERRIEFIPSVRKVVALCNALSIPWTNKRS